jgi:hypothetical protein
MAPNGRLLVIGFASGRIPALPANLALVKVRTLCVFSLLLLIFPQGIFACGRAVGRAIGS